MSVGYSKKLKIGLPLWLQGCDQIYVVTDKNDKETYSITKLSKKIFLYSTEVFYEKGASFNKGKALNEIYELLNIKSKWMCIFDSDIVPPKKWNETIIPFLKFGNLHSAPRFQDGEKFIPDNPYEMAGYFWIFHSEDPHIPRCPTFTSWKHAGNYDTIFRNNWLRSERTILPLKLNHIGNPGKNWWGIGNTEKMTKMYEERRKRNGDYMHESV